MKNLNKRTILIYGIGFIIARASFNGMNPLAIGFFTAAMMSNLGKGMAFIVTFLGIASIMEPTEILKYTLTMIATLVLMESPLLKNRNVSEPVQYGIPAISLCIFSLLEVTAEASFAEYAVLAVLEAVIVVVAAGMFKTGIDYILQLTKGLKMNNEQMISIAAIVAVLIYAVPDFHVEYITPLKTLVYFMVLFFTYKYGVGQGTVTGAVSGFALGLRGGSVADIGIFTLMGIIPAV
ncbi:MAG TPA: hypothetical protein VN258_09515, partial [Mobilitalea sp.]|nr:hypothetical protein [Mobilitalea sp.]